MSANAFSEESLVEQAAADVLASLNWTVINAKDETFGPGSLLGRASNREVTLPGTLRAALTSLNPGAPLAAIDLAVDQLTADRTAMDPVSANREVHRLLLGGVKVTLKDPRTGRDEPRSLRVIDWERPSANTFTAVRQFAILGTLYRCIPDTVLFVNGLPLVVIEFKRPGVPAREGFDENLTSYKHAQNGVPGLFAFNAFLVASNGTQARVGSLSADWDRFFEWKRIEREDEPRRVSLEVLLRGTCDHTRLLDLVANFTLFSEHKTGLVKVLGQNHQFLGVNNALAATLKARTRGDGRAGVFWQTQGSGKSFSMVFYAQKILRTVPGDWTFVVVTDRVELDDQIARTFGACGAVADVRACHASSAQHLRELLSQNHRYIFTLIHKFKDAATLCDRRDVVVIVDEAHRSQYDTLAMNMRAALPNALFVAFTGTPLLAGEERTREVFGDYVSIYDYQQSIEDGATVPLHYENRTPELQLTNPDLNDELYDVIDQADLDEASEARLAQLLGQQYHLLTRDDRLDTVARDITQHFLARGFAGKAMVVSIDKATALRTYTKVRACWDRELERVKQALLNLELGHPDTAALLERQRRLQAVDMAVIVSPGQNEIADMQRLGLDIVPHRQRMRESQPALDEKFKDPNDPLSLVFVCAMWLTGFDAPSCSTVYLDKPMRNHTLMQTIARANRVFPEKANGLIVDYANVFASLERALAIYAKGKKAGSPVQNKDALAEELRSAIKELAGFCARHGVHFAELEADIPAIERLTRVGLAVNALMTNDQVRKAFLAQAKFTERLYAAVKPHRAAVEFAPRMSAITSLAEKIKLETDPERTDLTDVLRRIGDVLDRSIEGVRSVGSGPPPLDLSRLDVEALAQRFKRSPSQALDLERLKAGIRAQLDRLIQANETRADLRQKFEELIAQNNEGSRQIEQLFQELLRFSSTLTEEQARHVRENLEEEELVVFDLLTRPGPELTAAERAEVKKLARGLLPKVRRLATRDWQQTAMARARVKDTIEAELDAGLPRAYTPEVFKAKAEAVFHHVYERYGKTG